MSRVTQTFTQESSLVKTHHLDKLQGHHLPTEFDLTPQQKKLWDLAERYIKECLGENPDHLRVSIHASVAYGYTRLGVRIEIAALLGRAGSVLTARGAYLVAPVDPDGKQYEANIQHLVDVSMVFDSLFDKVVESAAWDMA